MSWDSPTRRRQCKAETGGGRWPILPPPRLDALGAVYPAPAAGTLPSSDSAPSSGPLRLHPAAITHASPVAWAFRRPQTGGRSLAGRPSASTCLSPPLPPALTVSSASSNPQVGPSPGEGCEQPGIPTHWGVLSKGCLERLQGGVGLRSQPFVTGPRSPLPGVLAYCPAHPGEGTKPRVRWHCQVGMPSIQMAVIGGRRPPLEPTVETQHRLPCGMDCVPQPSQTLGLTLQDGEGRAEQREQGLCAESHGSARLGDQPRPPFYHLPHPEPPGSPPTGWPLTSGVHRLPVLGRVSQGVWSQGPAVVGVRLSSSGGPGHFASGPESDGHTLGAGAGRHDKVRVTPPGETHFLPCRSKLFTHMSVQPGSMADTESDANTGLNNTQSGLLGTQRAGR